MINWPEVENRSLLFADVLVRSEEGWPVALVEIKNRPGLSAEIASAIRRNLIVHGFVSQQVPYVLVVSQDAGFLWDQRHPGHPEDPPTAAFSMQPILSHYVRWLTPGERLSGGALDFVVANWLSDLASGLGPNLPEATDPLIETGFLDSLRGAAVTLNERV